MLPITISAATAFETVISARGVANVNGHQGAFSG
jgi:hypothetical protein